MSDARDEIFASIRRSLGVTGREASRRAAVTERLRHSPQGPIPARAAADDLVAAFVREAERVQTMVTRLASSAQVPAHVARLLCELGAPPTVRLGGDPRLAAMPWSAAGIELAPGPATGAERCAISHALGAVAETGALALVSGPDNPTTLSFLPEDHIIVIEAGDVVGSIEALWATLRARFGRGGMPRCLNLIAGPSRTADLEQTMMLGAHGPRRLHALLTGG